MPSEFQLQEGFVVSPPCFPLCSCGHSRLRCPLSLHFPADETAHIRSSPSNSFFRHGSLPHCQICADDEAPEAGVCTGPLSRLAPLTSFDLCLLTSSYDSSSAASLSASLSEVGLFYLMRSRMSSSGKVSTNLSFVNTTIVSAALGMQDEQVAPRLQQALRGSPPCVDSWL